MRNLEDRKLHQQVERMANGFRAIGFKVTRETIAGAKAYMEAVKHPGSLIRVTVPVANEQDVFNAIASGDRPTNEIDWVKTSAVDPDIYDNDPKLLIFIEFKNGSAIELKAP